MNENSCCSTSSPAFGVVSVLDLGHSNRCIVESHWLNLQFPNDMWCGASFHMLIVCHLYIFGKQSLKVLGCLFSCCWVLRVLCIFWIIVLYQMCLLQIFSPSLWLVFPLLTVSLTEWKFFILMEYSWSVISFMDHALGAVSKKWLLNWKSSRFSPVLSSRTFVILYFIVKFVIHF